MHRRLHWQMLLALVSLTGGCDAILGLKKATLFDPDAGSSSVTTTGGTGGAGGTGGIATTSAAGGGAGGESGSCIPDSTSPCYDGPPDTAGVSLCHAGTHVCEKDGTTFGPCIGQMTPAPETCGGTVDTNCDGFLCGDAEWIKDLPQNSNYTTGGVGVDGTGNVYVAGTFTNPMQIGNKTLLGFGGTDVFVAKFTSKGTLLWAKQFGDVGDEAANGMAVDTAGNVIITGSTSASVDFGSGNAVSGLVYILKLDPAGNHVWSHSCGGVAPPMTYITGGKAISFDSQGDVIVAGEFGGTANCGDAPRNSAGGLDILLAKLSGSDGHALWSKAFGDVKDQYVKALAVDSAGSAMITGIANGSVNFGGMDLVGGAFYMARFSPTGAHNWSRNWGKSNEAGPSAMVIDANGTIAMSGGYSSSSFTFGGAAFPAATQFGPGAFVATFTNTGTHVWSNGFAMGEGTGVAIRADGGVTFTGSAGAGANVGGGDLGNGQCFIADFDNNGAYLRSRSFGHAPNNAAGISAMALGPAGEVALFGTLFGTVDFGGVSLTSTSPGAIDDFLLKLAP